MSNSLSDKDTQAFHDVFNDLFSKLRYGRLWDDFTISELSEYARFKTKRGNLIYFKNNKDREKAIDDIGDAINCLAMCILKMKDESE